MSKFRFKCPNHLAKQKVLPTISSTMFVTDNGFIPTIEQLCNCKSCVLRTEKRVDLSDDDIKSKATECSNKLIKHTDGVVCNAIDESVNEKNNSGVVVPDLQVNEQLKHYVDVSAKGIQLIAILKTQMLKMSK